MIIIHLNKRNKKTYIIRIGVLVLFLIPVLFVHDVYTHVYAHFMGNIKSVIHMHQWHLVILNILAFSGFLIPLSFRRTISWKEYGIVTAFIISLFVEMYGIPLTVYFASNYFSPSSDMIPRSVFSINVFGTVIDMSATMVYGMVVMGIGTLFVLIGWITLYKNITHHAIVTQGIYSISRHPQYLGFMLIIIGWLIGWPTLLTVVFAPLLILLYIRVCMTEEKQLSILRKYQNYKSRVPFLI